MKNQSFLSPPSKDTASRLPSTSQEGIPHWNLTMPAPGSWTSQSPQLGENKKFLLFKPPNLRYFVIAAGET